MRKRFWASGALAAALALAGCGGGSSEQSADATLRVYVSLPLRGESGAGGRDAADGALLALADAGGEAGGVTVEAVVLDDTEGAGGAARWTPPKAAANARRATQDSTAIAYLGDFESGATRASLPLTNEARMLQVSPASGAVDLAAPFPGSDELPAAQPGGERSFGRVIPADDAQARAGADWASRLGLERLDLVSDGTRFAETLAGAFESEARELGIETASGREPPLYLAGEPEVTPAGRARAIASDVYLDAPAPPRRVTSAALDPSQLPPAGLEFVTAFEAEHGRRPGRYAAYGYEAMALTLDSIERASNPRDRAAVIDAFFETTDRESILGTYSIDEVGDTTLATMTGYRGGARPRPVARIEG